MHKLFCEEHVSEMKDFSQTKICLLLPESINFGLFMYERCYIEDCNGVCKKKQNQKHF